MLRASDHSSGGAHDFNAPTRSDHRNHVHVAVGPTFTKEELDKLTKDWTKARQPTTVEVEVNRAVAPGTLMAKGQNGTVRPAQPGDEVVGVAGRLMGRGNIEINFTDGGVISSPGSVWASPASSPLEDLEALKRLMLGNTRSAQ